jgi:hypothetical protein
VNEGKTWGYFDGQGRPLGGTGSDRWTCPRGYWEPNVYEHPWTGEMVQDQERPNVWVSQCKIGRGPEQQVKRDSCACGVVFIYP